jgi:two-component system OmpR family response regulator
VTKGGKELQLAAKEFALLEFLMRHPDQVFSQDILLERVWLNESDTTADSLRVHIMRLRSKIDREGEESMIRTVHRQGYKLVTPGKPD